MVYFPHKNILKTQTQGIFLFLLTLLHKYYYSLVPKANKVYVQTYRKSVGTIEYYHVEALDCLSLSNKQQPTPNDIQTTPQSEVGIQHQRERSCLSSLEIEIVQISTQDNIKNALSFNMSAPHFEERHKCSESLFAMQ